MKSDLELYYFLYHLEQIRWLYFIAKYFSSILHCEMIARCGRLDFDMIWQKYSTFNTPMFSCFRKLFRLTSVVVHSILFILGARADENSWD